MTKHFCDKCGKEISLSENYPIRNIAVSFKSSGGKSSNNLYYFELCNSCTNELIKFIENKPMAPDPIKSLHWDGNF